MKNSSEDLPARRVSLETAAPDRNEPESALSLYSGSRGRPIAKVLESYAQKSEAHREAQRKAKQAKQELDELEAEVIQALETLRIPSITLATGYRITLKEGWRVRLADSSPEACSQLREVSWFEGLVRDCVHPQTLAASVRSVLEKGESLPPEVEERLEIESIKSAPVTKEPLRKQHRAG